MTEPSSDPAGDPPAPGGGPVAAPQPARRRRRPLGLLATAVGTVVVLMAVDLGLGAAWEAASPDPDADVPEAIDGAIRVEASSAEPIDLDPAGAPELPPDPREDEAPMSAYPWRHEYFQELQRATSTYWPYVLWKPRPATGRHINIDADGVRRSHRSRTADGPRPPIVDLYGGSAMFGEGQRDQHTIPSEVVRLAEAAGTPIVARNRGVRGWVNWQEVLLFEQVAADPARRPDLAVFYDGANEVLAQNESIRGVPGHSSIDDTRRKMSGEPPGSAGEAGQQPDGWDHLGDAAEHYRRSSAAARAGRWLRELVTGEPAGAAPLQDGPPGGDAGDLASIPGIYRRGRALIEDIAERTEVEPLFFWQPYIDGGWDGYAAGIDAPTVDLSDALADHDDVFLDAVHTDEEGARLAAEAIWEHLGPRVAAWYDRQG